MQKTLYLGSSAKNTASAYTVAANTETVVFPPPLRKPLIGCHWLYRIKIGSDGKIDCFKACLWQMINSYFCWITVTISHISPKWSLFVSSLYQHDIEMPLPWFVWLTGHFMVLNSLHELCMRNSTL